MQIFDKNILAENNLKDQLPYPAIFMHSNVSPADYFNTAAKNYFHSVSFVVSSNSLIKSSPRISCITTSAAYTEVPATR